MMRAALPATDWSAIGQFIDPSMSLWKVQRLLEDSVYPCTREGKNYVASKTALRARWHHLTRAMSERDAG
jgi:hypothetical protein